MKSGNTNDALGVNCDVYRAYYRDLSSNESIHPDQKCGFYIGLIVSKEGHNKIKYGYSNGRLDKRPTEEICKQYSDAKILGIARVRFLEKVKDDYSHRRKMLEKAEKILSGQLAQSKTLKRVDGEYYIGNPKRVFEKFKFFAGRLAEGEYMEGSVEDVTFISGADMKKWEIETNYNRKLRTKRTARIGQTPKSRAAILERDRSSSPEDAAETQIDSPSPASQSLRRLLTSPAQLSPPRLRRKLSSSPFALSPGNSVSRAEHLQDTLLDTQEDTPETLPADSEEFARTLAASPKAASSVMSRSRHRLQRMQNHLRKSPVASKAKPFPSPRSRRSRSRQFDNNSYKRNASMPAVIAGNSKKHAEVIEVPDTIDEASVAATELDNRSPDGESAASMHTYVDTDIDPTTSGDGDDVEENQLPPALRGRVQKVMVRNDARGGRNVVATLTEPLEESQYHPFFKRTMKSGRKTMWVKPNAEHSTQDVVDAFGHMM